MTCYWKTGNEIQSFNDTLAACGPTTSGAVACCSRGDECLSDGICHYTEPSAGGSGYYLGGCTDPTYNDPACVQACSDMDFQDVVYNYTAGLWSCCGGQHSCNDPVSDRTFQSPPPSQLAVINKIDASLPSAAPSAPASTTTAPSLLAGPAPAGGIQLSNWAQIGIAVAATVVFQTLLALAVWRIVVCKRRRRAALVQPQQPGSNHYNAMGYAGRQRGLSNISELDAGPPKAYVTRREMEG